MNNNQVTKILDCFINSNKKCILYKTHPESWQEFDICLANFDNQEEIDFINKANRYFMKRLFKLSENDRKNADGYLPVKCILQDKVEENSCISPKYILNLFIKLIQLITSDSDDNQGIFSRDKDYTLPASTDKMKEIMNELIQSQIHGEFLVSNDNMENGFAFVQQFLQLFMKQLDSVQNLVFSKIDNIQNNSKLKRNTNFTRGINLTQINQKVNKVDDQIINSLLENIHESSHVVHDAIRQHRMTILSQLLNNASNSYTKRVIEIIQDSPDVAIYENQEISFDLMFNTIGEIFNIAFMVIFPKISMTLSVMGSLYYTTVMKELGIINVFGRRTQIPIISRLIYSCKDCKLAIPDLDRDMAEEYFKMTFPFVYNQIKSVNTNGIIPRMNSSILHTNQNQAVPYYKMLESFCENYERNLDFVLKLGRKFNINDELYSNRLFTFLNDQRGHSYEYYLIAILGIFSNTYSRYNSLGKNNKALNEKNFITPVHCILTLFFCYINNNSAFILEDLTYENIELLLNGFAMTYKDEINGALKDMFTTATRIFNSTDIAN